MIYGHLLNKVKHNLVAVRLKWNEVFNSQFFLAIMHVATDARLLVEASHFPRCIKIQPNTIDLLTRLWEINTEPRALLSIVLG